jgi:hypothetical protein
MIFSKSHFWSLVFACSIVLVSCKTKGDEQPSPLYQTGVFIINEGPFGSGTGTVSYYDRDADVLKNDIYGTENSGAVIGNILQSMSINGDKAYLMANNANKMVVVDTKTFKTSATLATDLILPRYFLPIDAARGYITQWGKDSATSGIVVYDYATNKIAKTIPTGGKGANHIIRQSTSAIWVLNSGGLGKDSTVTIVNSSSDSVIQKITVGPQPNGIVEDVNSDIWVVCQGEYLKNNGKLVKIRNKGIEYSFTIPDGVSNLITDKTKSTLYFLANNQIYQKDLLNFGANAPTVLMKPADAKALYALGIDPKTGYLWCGDALDYTKAGIVYIIDPATKIEKKRLTVGVIPNGFLFQN